MFATLLEYLPTLLLTLLLEGAVVMALARRSERALTLEVCLALNLLTHPLASLLAWHWQPDVLLLEVPVVLGEWLGYAQVLRCTLAHALLLSVAANAASWLAGVLLWAITAR